MDTQDKKHCKCCGARIYAFSGSLDIKDGRICSNCQYRLKLHALPDSADASKLTFDEIKAKLSEAEASHRAEKERHDAARDYVVNFNATLNIKNILKFDDEHRIFLAAPKWTKVIKGTDFETFSYS